MSLDLKPVLKSAKICDHFLHFEKKQSQKSQISNFTSMTFGMMTSKKIHHDDDADPLQMIPKIS